MHTYKHANARGISKENIRYSLFWTSYLNVDFSLICVFLFFSIYFYISQTGVVVFIKFFEWNSYWNKVNLKLIKIRTPVSAYSRSSSLIRETVLLVFGYNVAYLRNQARNFYLEKCTPQFFLILPKKQSIKTKLTHIYLYIRAHAHGKKSVAEKYFGRNRINRFIPCDSDIKGLIIVSIFPGVPRPR